MNVWTPDGHKQVIREMEATPRDWAERRSGLFVPPSVKPRYQLPVAVELFAGAGGMGCGLHQAGYHVAAAVEMDFDSAVTYTVNLAQPGVKFHFDTPEREAAFEKHLEKVMGLNKKLKKGETYTPPRFSTAGSGWISHYDCNDQHHTGRDCNGEHNDYLASINGNPTHAFGCQHFWVADIRNVTGGEILDALGLDVGEVDLVTGGPPCQGFSMAGKRNVMDPRNSLVFEFARLILEIQPKAFVMENVPGILSMVTEAGVAVIDAMCRVIADGGFAEFDALRRSLLMSSGNGAALKGGRFGDSKRRKERVSFDEDDDEEPASDELPPMLALLESRS